MTRLPKNKISVSVSISLDLLSEIDNVTYLNNETRSEFIVKAIKKRLEEIKNEK